MMVRMVVMVGVISHVCGEVNTMLRLHHPLSAVNYNEAALREFEIEFIGDAAAALGIPQTRLSIGSVTDGNEVAADEAEYGARRRRTNIPYRGETMLVHLTISPGSPSSEELYTKLRKLTEDQNSAWYQGEMSRLTDAGLLPPDKLEQSCTDAEHSGRMPLALILPVGAAPLGLMFMIYFMMAGGSQRKIIAGERASDEKPDFKENSEPNSSEELEGKDSSKTTSKTSIVTV